MSWNQEEMNEVYLKVQKMATTDEEFRNELLKDSKAAIEKVSGKEMPDGFQVNVIENDPAYAATFVLPDFVGDEIEEGELDQVAGGISVLLIVSACAGAIGTDTCAGDACAGKLSSK